MRTLLTIGCVIVSLAQVPGLAQQAAPPPTQPPQPPVGWGCREVG